MTFYLSITILAALLMLAMALHVLNYSGFTKQQRNWYLATFLSIMLCMAAEYAVHCGSYDDSFAIPLTIVTVFQFTLAPLLGVLFSGALGAPHQRRYVCLFLICNLLIEALAAPFGLIFYFNEEGYFRGDFFFLYQLLYFISILYLIFNLIVVGRTFHHRDTRTICMVLVVIIAGIVPMTFFKVNVTYLAIAIGASLCYIYYNDLVQQDIQDQLVRNQKKMSAMQDHIIFGMANLIENRDMETGGHITRTSDYVKKLAEFARSDGIYADALDDHFISMLFTLAPMHDIGKIVIPDKILKKPGKLTEQEYEQMKDHAAAGGAMVREVLRGIAEEEYLSFASDIATYHHERWDGTGYPNGLKGEDIPLPARIMAIADVFDALISQRCYKRAMSPETAFCIIKEESGTHFDPKLAKVFLDHKDAFLETEEVTGA